jgi:N-acyl-D-amino-acid deacylase
LVFLSLLPAPPARGDEPRPPVRATGRADPRLASFDRLMTSFLADNDVTGAALAVARHGRIVYARGFGLADIDRAEPVRPRSLFRIASVSKPITAAAVLQLVERGRLGLDDRVVDRLDLRRDGKAIEPGDPRLNQVTIRHLLQHRGGWDRDKSFDPMFRSLRIAREFNEPPPAGPALILASMWKRPLDFDPGARSAYSNFGYCVLGRLIEKVSGRSYEEYVRDEVLAPLGIRGMRIGRTLESDRARGEVRYYVAGKHAKTGRGVVGPKLGQDVPRPYGGWYLEAMDAHGGWIASAPDLVRFASAFSPPRLGTVVNEKTVETMFARPEGRAGHRADGTPKPSYYACGWQVREMKEGGRNTWHGGYLDGATSLLVRRHDGLDWAVLFNTDSTRDDKSPAVKIDPLIHKAADAVEEWPDRDLEP